MILITVEITRQGGPAVPLLYDPLSEKNIFVHQHANNLKPANGNVLWRNNYGAIAWVKNCGAETSTILNKILYTIMRSNWRRLISKLSICNRASLPL